MARILVVGEQESFLIRILVKKLCDAGMEARFAAWRVDELNAMCDGADLVTLYMDEGTRPGDEALHFLVDRLTDRKRHMLVVGDADDVAFVAGRTPSGLIFRTFLRPVDSAALLAAAAELLSKETAGELKKSILIVDDDPNYLGLVREWLKGTYKVAMANSGTQALKWLGLNRADLILLDYEMPVTSGPMVMEMLRAEEETRNIPIIFLTGKSDKESVMAVMALKPDGYFLKNIERTELLARLEEYFALHM